MEKSQVTAMSDTQKQNKDKEEIKLSAERVTSDNSVEDIMQIVDSLP